MTINIATSWTNQVNNQSELKVNTINWPNTKHFDSVRTLATVNNISIEDYTHSLM